MRHARFVTAVSFVTLFAMYCENQQLSIGATGALQSGSNAPQGSNGPTAPTTSPAPPDSPPSDTLDLNTSYDVIDAFDLDPYRDLQHRVQPREGHERRAAHALGHGAHVLRWPGRAVSYGASTL